MAEITAIYKLLLALQCNNYLFLSYLCLVKPQKNNKLKNLYSKV